MFTQLAIQVRNLFQGFILCQNNPKKNNHFFQKKNDYYSYFIHSLLDKAFVDTVTLHVLNKTRGFNGSVLITENFDFRSQFDLRPNLKNSSRGSNTGGSNRNCIQCFEI